MTLSLIFKGFDYVADFNGAYSEDDSLSSMISSTASNAVALTEDYGINVDTSTVYADPNITETISALQATGTEAKNDGLSVMVRPLIDFTNNAVTGGYSDGEWRAYYEPSNIATFFASYQTMIVAQATAAQAIGAPLFCIGTELDQLTGPAYLPQWTAIIDAVKAVYSGKLTYSAIWDDNLSPWQYGGATKGTGNITTQVSFWNQLDYVGLDVYAPLSDAGYTVNPADGSITPNGQPGPTEAQLVAGWNQVPTDPTTLAVTGQQSLISYFEGISNSVGKPLLFTELGYNSAPDAAVQPFYTSSGSYDPTLQAQLYQSFVTAWTTSGNTSLQGVYIWNWEPDPSNPNLGLGSSPNWSPQDGTGATGSLAVLKTAFSATAASLTEPIIVPQYATGIIQLYTPDPTTGAPTVDGKYTVNVGSILGTLFPGLGLIAAPNAVVLHGNNLFFTNSSSNSQAVFELPNYLTDPAAAIAGAFVVTLDGSDYTGLAFDATGHLYTAEGSYGNNQIVRYTLPAGTPSAANAGGDNYVARTVIGNAGATSYFGDLTFDASGNLWAADYQNSRVVAYDAAHLGTTDTWHAIDNVAGPLAVANTTSGLTAASGHLFAEPEGVAFDGTGTSANLWVGNNNDDGAGVLNTLTSLVEITKPLQSLILATPSGSAVSAADVVANGNAFIYQVPNNVGGGVPQFGGIQIDTKAGVLYANEEVGGDARAYALSAIAATPLDPSASLLAVTTTNPGNGGLALVTGALPCFREGTRLESEHGPVAVEALQPGMRLRTAGGALRPIVWIGHSRVDCRRHARPPDVLPVRVAAGAMGEGLPRRDLWLSPDHALLVDGYLVPVRYLLNGATIVQEAAGRVGYFHVELATHDILLAEGMPAESYLDTGNRGAFANGGGARMLHPDFARGVWQAQACADLLLDGPVLAGIRRRLLAVARTLGYRLSDDPRLRVLIDGIPAAASIDGARWRVSLPPRARQVRLVSRRWVPAHARPDARDTRILGVAVANLRLDDRSVDLEDSRLSSGWAAPEPDWRWTDGNAGLALAGVGGISFDVVMAGDYWTPGHRARRRADGPRGAAAG
jgi:hypothetical protein